ncbi:MAG: DNA polymerase Y family protein [Pseudomonadota bacterium]
MSLWLCLRLTRLPLQCLNRDETQAVVVLARQRVVSVNDCAAALGIRIDMASATVHGLANGEPLQLLERDESAEQRCLQQLCCWAYGITPVLYSQSPDCLQLEIGGCLNLFQGLDKLMDEVHSGIGCRGYHMAYGLAPTPKAAWLLSFAPLNTAIAIDQPLTERLAPLPLERLHDFPAAVDSLRRAGLHTIGDILRLPDSALSRRCGKAFSDFLQQVLGEREDRQADFQPPARFNDEYWFGYEIRSTAELLPATQLLLQSLCAFLRSTQLRTAQIQWQLIGIDHSLREVTVRSASTHSDWYNWQQLTTLCFEQLQLDTAVEGLALSCDSLLPGQQDNLDLFQAGRQREPLAHLLDRLRSRLGLQAIEKVGCRDEHLPEFAVHVGNDRPGGEPLQGHHCAQRPFWLMPQPQLLKERRGKLYWKTALRLEYGPERIEDNWWQEAVSRDYYIAGDDAGQRYWVFRDRLHRQWYVHGIFA